MNLLLRIKSISCGHFHQQPPQNDYARNFGRVISAAIISLSLLLKRISILIFLTIFIQLHRRIASRKFLSTREN